MPKKIDVSPLDTTYVTSRKQAESELLKLSELQKEIRAKEDQAVFIKQAVTAYAIGKKIDVFQFDGFHYRLVTRTERGWNPIKLKKLLKDKKANGKSLWNLVTRRVVDSELLDAAIKQGWVKEKEIEKAYEERPGKSFLQRYTGRAS